MPGDVSVLGLTPLTESTIFLSTSDSTDLDKPYRDSLAKFAKSI